MQGPYQVAFGARINPSSPTPAYLQVTGAIIRDIQRGRLAHGAFLPSSRRLAVQLNLNRKTIVLAYEELISQGWLEASGTRGTMVAAHFPHPDARAPLLSVLRNAKPKPRYHILPTPIHEAAPSKPATVVIDGGDADPRLFPFDVLSQAYRTVISRPSATTRLNRVDPSGTPRLRSALSEMLRAERGLNADSRDIFVTRGRQNGLFLVAKALLNPGDTVLVEELTYERAVTAFRMMGANVIPIRFNGPSIDLDEVERACRQHRVRAVYLTPHNQFPTTSQLSPENRLRLLNLAGQFGYAIIEDDYGNEFNFVPQPLMPMMAYAPEHVIFLGSLSTALVPGLRVGYVHASGRMIAALAHYAAHVDVMGNPFTEEATAELIAGGALRRHANKAYRIYAQRRGRLAEILRAKLDDNVVFEMPRSGLAFWLRFPEVASQDLAGMARDMGLRLASLQASSLASSRAWGLRFGFASMDGNEMERAVELLGAALGRTRHDGGENTL